jgi:hypothetical protein
MGNPPVQPPQDVNRWVNADPADYTFDRLDALNLDYQFVWRSATAGMRADAKALWTRLGILPSGVDADKRADELCAVAYQGTELVGVSTAGIARIESLRQKFAMVRVLVIPRFRSYLMSWKLSGIAYDGLQAWSQSNPHEQVMGMGSVIENEGVNAMRSPPFWPLRPGDPPRSGSVLIGYTDKNEQVRVAWFDHAIV